MKVVTVSAVTLTLVTLTVVAVTLVIGTEVTVFKEGGDCYLYFLGNFGRGEWVTQSLDIFRHYSSLLKLPIFDVPVL